MTEGGLELLSGPLHETTRPGTLHTPPRPQVRQEMQVGKEQLLFSECISKKNDFKAKQFLDCFLSQPNGIASKPLAMAEPQHSRERTAGLTGTAAANPRGSCLGTMWVRCFQRFPFLSAVRNLGYVQSGFSFKC